MYLSDMQTANARRVQQHYRRRQRGVAVFTVEANEQLLSEELVIAGFLDARDIDDRKAISRALQEAVGVMIARGGR
jgi:hypothetical protein